MAEFAGGGGKLKSVRNISCVMIGMLLAAAFGLNAFLQHY
jgi:hypothetical protein